MATVALKNHKRFNDSLIAGLEYSRRPLEVSMREQARGIVSKVIAVTPPGGRVSGLLAKKQGLKTIEGNIKKVIMGVPKAKARDVGYADIKKWHRKARVRGRVRGRARRGKELLRAPSSLVNRYVRQRQKGVGHLASGWNKAAVKFRVSPRNHPAWIRRHKAPTSASIKISKSAIRIRFSNRTKFVADVGVMMKRLDWALHSQARANEKRTWNAVRSGMRKSGWFLTS